MDKAIMVRGNVLQATGIALDDLIGPSRRGDLVTARVTIARLAHAAGCDRASIAAVIGRSKSQATRLRVKGLEAEDAK
ncbi:MAG: hypothetical protein ACRCS3_07980 [Paracoccaceae bacterium]